MLYTSMVVVSVQQPLIVSAAEFILKVTGYLLLRLLCEDQGLCRGSNYSLKICAFVPQ